MSEQTYDGGCHCGAITYRVNADISTVLECNCSICRRAGWQLSFVAASQFELLSGQQRLVDYQFGKEQLHHPFCQNCGIRSFSYGDGEDGQQMYAVNTRCLKGFKTDGIEVNQYDGAST